MTAPAACCLNHQPAGCCDPSDCGPCCPECPTCPVVQAWTGSERAEHARLCQDWTVRFSAQSVRVRSAVRALVDLDDLDGLRARLAKLGQATAEAVDVLPKRSPWFSQSGVLP